MEVVSGQTSDTNSSSKSISTPKQSTEATTSPNNSPDVSATSPISKSRYGRTRKPKISEDFYNIDVIFEASRETKKSPRATPQIKSPVLKSVKSNQSPPKVNSSAVLKSPKPNNFVHVTGDTVAATTESGSISSNNEITKTTVRKFFKRESITTTTLPHNSKEVDNKEVDISVSALSDESVDVTKVLKIISQTKTPEALQNSADSKGSFKPVLKTYSNKRKNFQKMIVVESFGLPDKPIFPLENDKGTAASLNEPKRIKNLDVAAPSSENEINIVDKKLLDTPWKIANINTDFADNEILLDTSCEDSQDENKIVNETKSVSEESLLKEETSDNKFKPNKTKKVSPKKQKQVSENLPNKIIKTSPKKLVSKKLTTKELLLIQETDNKIQKNIRSPRKQRQVIISEQSLKAENNIKSPKILRSNSPRKPTKPENNASILETSIEDKVNVNETKILRSKSPRKQQQKKSSELLLETSHDKETVLEESKIAISPLQKRKRSLSPNKTVSSQHALVSTPQRKSLRLQLENQSDNNLTKKKLNINSMLSEKKIKNTDKTVEQIDLLEEEGIDEQLNNELVLETTLENNHSNVTEEQQLDEMDLETRIKKSIDEDVIVKNIKVIKTRGRKSKIENNVLNIELLEKSEEEKELQHDEECLGNDLDDMNLLERSLLLSEPNKTSELVLEIKEEMDIDDDEAAAETDKQVSVSSTVMQDEEHPQQQEEETNHHVEPEKSLYDLQIKAEPEDVELGDLMWAKIGGHPYWPCVISEDPVLKEYKSIRKRVKNYVTYHVRFFGDRGRRSWVSSSSVIRFTNKNDLSILYEKVKRKTSTAAMLQPYIVKPAALPKWENAVSEAESLKSSTTQQRFDFFFKMFASEEEQNELLLTNVEKKKTTSKSSPEKEVKQELLETSPINIKQKSKTAKLNIKKSVVKASKTGHNKILAKTSSITRSKSVPPNAVEPQSENKKENLDSFEADLIKPIKKGVSKSNKNDLESISHRNSLPVQKDIISKNKIRENSIDEPPDTLVKNPWQVFDMAKRQLNTPLNEVNSECSLSDTDSHSKSSTNTPIPNTYKEQNARQRRNNLFRGIPRHRVCQVCKKPGEIFKCKGPCNGLFHSECSGVATTDSSTVIIKEEAENASSDSSNCIKIDKLKEDDLLNGIPDSNNLEKITEIDQSNTENKIKPSDDVSLVTKNDSSTIEIKEEEKATKNGKNVADTGNTNKVEIIHIDCDDSDFEHSLTPKVRLTPNRDFSSLSLAEQIDMKMKEIMQKFEKNTRYADSTTDYTSSEESTSNLLPPAPKPKIVQKKKALKIKHVTADCISFAENSSSEDLIGEGTSTDTSQIINSSTSSQGVTSTANNSEIIIESVNNDCLTESTKGNKIGKNIDQNNAHIADCEASSGDLNSIKEFKCGYCIAEIDPPCFVCSKEVSSKDVPFRQKCSLHKCGKFYHPECLKMWPQTQWSLISTAKHKNSNKVLDTFVCPVHVCHTCASDNPRVAISRCSSDKVVKCLRCPATYHTTNYCVPAGTLILSTSQIVCPRHLGQTVIKKGKVVKFARTINTPWCFICSKGGDLICCETCPTSVHADCLQINLLEDGAFICEDCETGRFPLYDEIVWVKLGAYRWWPAVILFPNEIPDNIKNIPHNKGEFVVKFFGTHDHYWVHRGRVFLFQEGDRGHCSPTRKRVDALFKKSIEEAAAAHHFKKVFKMSKDAEVRTGMKPPPYIRVKVNKPVGNVRLFDGNISNTTSCECDPNQANPCGPDSDCLNRLLLTECDPNICPAKEKCNNQRFEKRQYPPLLPFKTPARGWGLKTVTPIRKGDFIIEYVGEIIDEQEYQRRIHKMHEQKDENYYFLTIDKDRIIDAGPKGNLARFMNHCCQPNCETQKWTVNGDTRVGLFAMEDIPVDAELTFNYNLECIGKEKKICKCGAPNCSGFIGVKAKADESQKKPKKNNNNIKKKKQPLVQQVSKNDGPCFICGQLGDVGACHNKICTKFYHLQCVNLEVWPEGKWVCPWHNCDICSKRTIRCCVKCIHSYCPVHSEGNVRYDKLLGFICSEHDPTKESQEISNENLTTVKNSTLFSTTEETDVTSTTPDEIDPPKEINKNIVDDDDVIIHTCESPKLILGGETVTSTPIKNKDSTTSFHQSLEDFEDCLESHGSEASNIDNIPEKQSEKREIKSQLPTGGKRKRGRRPKRSAGNSPKKIKLSNETVVKLKHKFVTPNLLDIPAQNEVKLSSSVPTRHLRTTRSGVANTDTKRFLHRQSELEKDLPIRKRSRPRCEASL